jgi:molybdate transport system substrate-binding protein
MKHVLLATVAGVGFAMSAAAAEIKVLSAGAVESGMHAIEPQVKRELGNDLKIIFNTTPQITKRLAAGEVYDILILPPAAQEQAAKDGRIAADTRVPLGRVGAGIVVRSGVNVADITTVDALKQALLAADSVVYNSASSGIYLDKLFAKMGVLDQIKPKTTRYPDAAPVMQHVAKGKGIEIGFGPITEIRPYEAKGLRYVGPLPAEVQNYTSYEAALMTGAPAADAAKAVLRLLATPAAKATFTAAGIE